jgi:hypothetical protein
MASLPRHSHIRNRAASTFHSLGTRQSQGCATKCIFTVRPHYCNSRTRKELPLPPLSFHLPPFSPPKIQQTTNFNPRDRFHSLTGFTFPATRRPLPRALSCLSLLAKSSWAHIQALQLFEPPDSSSSSTALQSTPAYSLSTTTTTKTNMQSTPPVQKVPSVFDGMDSSPEESDVSSVPTQSSTPEDFKTILAQYGMKPGTLTEIRDELISIAREAGDMMINADPSVCIESDTKNNTSDRVTQTGNVTSCSPNLYKPIVLQIRRLRTW